jgi:dolichyl-phosphate beta-glucosyltransferase
MLVSIVIPAFNEEAAIGGHLADVVTYCEPQEWDYEVVVVDDGSRDRTGERVRAFAERHRQVRLLALPQNHGRGYAVRAGLRAASGDIRGFTDADESTPIGELERVLPCFTAGAAVVIGSRAKRAEEVRVQAHLHRRIIGRVFNALMRGVLRITDADGKVVADTQCGFKWFTADACAAILDRASLDGFAFDVELLYLANRLGFPIVELPVNWADRGESRVNLLVDPAKMLGAVLTVPWRHRKVRGRAPAPAARR